MRLIDADDLRRNIDKSYPFDRETQRKHDAYDIAKGMLLVIIDKQQTVEPQRMRGRWVGTEFDGYADGNPVYYEWKCSVCDCLVEDNEPTWDYCPNCGSYNGGEE